jgi:hypothetical protein
MANHRLIAGRRSRKRWSLAYDSWDVTPQPGGESGVFFPLLLGYVVEVFGRQFTGLLVKYGGFSCPC